MKLIQSILALGAIASAAGLLLITTSSCNTTRGFGADVRELGHGIEKEAAQHTHY